MDSVEFVKVDHSSSKTRSAVVLIRLPEDSGEDVDDDDDDGHAADGGVVLVAESIVLLTAGEALDQQDARGDHLSKCGKKNKRICFPPFVSSFYKDIVT